MDIATSELFKMFFSNIGKANNSQDPVLNKRISAIVNDSAKSSDVKTFEIIEIFSKYSDVTHSIALVETLSKLLDIKSDVDLHNADNVLGLIKEVVTK